MEMFRIFLWFIFVCMILEGGGNTLRRKLEPTAAQDVETCTPYFKNWERQNLRGIIRCIWMQLLITIPPIWIQKFISKMEVER